MLLCNGCPRRETCVAICPKLESRLAAGEGYLREVPVSPRALAALADRPGGPAETAAEEEDGSWVWNLLYPELSRMRPEVVEVFLLHFQENLSAGEIAGLIGERANSVSCRLRRAVFHLRQALFRRAAEEVRFPPEEPRD